MAVDINTGIAVIYLLGAGRSGTTLIATVLDSSPHIQTLGEMHQFLDHMEYNKLCSCGNGLKECTFWGPVIKSLQVSLGDISSIRKFSEEKERHIKIPGYLLNTKANKQYLMIHKTIFSTLREQVTKPVMLDSSKYIARFLQLSRSTFFSVKGVYVVRDVRGVIQSFGKQVQTPKKPLMAIFYYLLINFFGELVYRSNKNVIKVRYEDFVNEPEIQLGRIHKHVWPAPTKDFNLSDRFPVPHIIGGNRMKSEKQVEIRKDLNWKNHQSRSRQITYYLAVWPFMLINKYKI